MLALTHFYHFELELPPNASEQEDTSDEDEQEDAYASDQIADEKWLAQY